ncbi:hypothetical protein AVCANL279_02565 [Campylobacter canadensis]|uniref:hypothetical protein n=1 Tax=Campylobacter canadensis TaxID=449520 RepID=UPI00155297BA|nr:hypothetical protein [Campylobacter canadensis]MBZ7994717.1 hypothetical protein [Campylobacter canadensis]MBZ7996213.1 hypothetical protein [Campylobacter canadensis]MBZ7999971.1 hypothetical protein [Campylobacter canadensis]MBZ8001644.1 hypothetical protein [Campylobacter canadensis]MBZ8003262.1 hypothetical protein [Campylobacter canadensis]
MSDFISIHIFFVYFLLFLEFLYLFFTQYFKDAHSYIFRIRVFLPLYYSVLAACFFTGILLEAFKHFDNYSFKYSLVFILILLLSIYEFILFKKTRKQKKVKDFKKYALIIEFIKLLGSISVILL